MDVGTGLRNAVPGTSGEQLTEFARGAEARAFSTLGTIDRVAYPNGGRLHRRLRGDGPETVRQYVSAFEQAGCDELILFPNSNDPGQVDLLADAVGCRGAEQGARES